jgi:hypothetical protein
MQVKPQSCSYSSNSCTLKICTTATAKIAVIRSGPSVTRELPWKWREITHATLSLSKRHSPETNEKPTLTSTFDWSTSEIVQHTSHLTESRHDVGCNRRGQEQRACPCGSPHSALTTWESLPVQISYKDAVGQKNSSLEPWGISLVLRLHKPGIILIAQYWKRLIKADHCITRFTKMRFTRTCFTDH